jgi:hypothetical protein
MSGSFEVKNGIRVDHLDPKENPELKAQRQNNQQTQLCPPVFKVTTYQQARKYTQHRIFTTEERVMPLMILFNVDSPVRQGRKAKELVKAICLPS